MDTEFTFAEQFKSIYPEFARVLDDTIERMHAKILCLFPSVSDISEPCRKIQVAAMVVAHFMSVETSADMAEYSTSSGAMLSSANVGDASVSTQSAPIKDMYEYFFGSTKYGLEFLAYLAAQGGLRYVN